MINVKELHFDYGAKSGLFEGLCMTLNPGTITGLLGKNGAGKTSLLKLLAGLLYPGSGTMDVIGHQSSKRQPSFLSQVFYVPEDFCLPSISIKNFIRANSPFYPKFDSQLMDELLEEFELTSDSSIKALSYGQKKKFLISFALATKCRLLILDEPSNGLDIPSKSLFRKVMAGTLDEDQLVIISTHQVKDIDTLIDRIVILDNGKIVLEKDMLEISSQLQFSSSYSNPGEGALYSEVTPGGYKVITAHSNVNSSVDLELLFNAVTTGKKIF